MRRRVSIVGCLLCATFGVSACGSGSANHSSEYDLAVIAGVLRWTKAIPCWRSTGDH